MIIGCVYYNPVSGFVFMDPKPDNYVCKNEASKFGMYLYYNKKAEPEKYPDEKDPNIEILSDIQALDRLYACLVDVYSGIIREVDDLSRKCSHHYGEIVYNK